MATTYMAQSRILRSNTAPTRTRPGAAAATLAADKEQRDAEQHREQGDELLLEENVHDPPRLDGQSLEGYRRVERVDIGLSRICKGRRIHRKDAKHTEAPQHIQDIDALRLARRRCL